MQLCRPREGDSHLWSKHRSGQSTEEWLPPIVGATTPPCRWQCKPWALHRHGVAPQVVIAGVPATEGRHPRWRPDELHPACRKAAVRASGVDLMQTSLLYVGLKMPEWG